MAKKQEKPTTKRKPVKPKQITAPAESKAVQAQTEPKLPQTQTQTQTDMLIQLAADKEFPVEKLKELIEMKNRQEDREAKKEFDLHFAEMQGEFPILPRSKKSKHHKYCPLEIMIQLCRPVISRHGFSYSFDATLVVNGKKTETLTINGHGSERKHSMEIYVEDPLKSNEGKQVTTRNQELGSADTYAHRYLFKAAFGLAEDDEDDDGNGGGKSTSFDDERKSSNDNPSCPTCDSNEKVIISKWPKNGKYFCLTCKKGFNAMTQPGTEPDQDSMSKEEREMICRELNDEEVKTFHADVLASVKTGGDSLREVRKKYRELYKSRLEAKNTATEKDEYANIPF